VIRFLILLLFISTAASAQATDPTPIRRTMSHPPVYVRAEEGLEGLVDEVLRLWPESATMIAADLGLTDLATVEIVLLKHSTWTRWSRGLLPEWGVGFANWPGGPIAIDAGRAVRDPGRFPQILRHEISHVYLGQRLDGRRPPTWFIEGVAQIQSGEWSFGDTMGLVQVASVGALPPLSRLQAGFPVGGRSARLAYRVSRQAVLEIDRRGADRGGWRGMLGPLAAGEPFDSVLAAISGLRLTAFEAVVENRLRIRYGWFAAVASASSLFTFMTLLFMVGAVRARLRTRQRLREMGEEEALHGFESEP
jgi:hypothetical protein